MSDQPTRRIGEGPCVLMVIFRSIVSEEDKTGRKLLDRFSVKYKVNDSEDALYHAFAALYEDTRTMSGDIYIENTHKQVFSGANVQLNNGSLTNPVLFPWDEGMDKVYKSDVRLFNSLQGSYCLTQKRMVLESVFGVRYVTKLSSVSKMYSGTFRTLQQLDPGLKDANSIRQDSERTVRAMLAMSEIEDE